VTADPFEYEITHPDDWPAVRSGLDDLAKGMGPLPVQTFENEEIRIQSDPIRRRDGPPEEYLEWTRGEMLKLAGVASAELADE